ncbi:hypothetical protein TA3x_004401 [Tundrisphaera sp. TA3]|uniref:hypothetical protein n=1 Tax=Tundrisphaera sp. TA3 TaxID=3435775 RepID=UPI003EBEB88F
MIPTQDAIEQLAERIQQAYRRRYPRWNSIGITPGAWEVAAARMISTVGTGGSIPVDPELFIAAQPQVADAHDPWAELAQEGSVRRYLKAVKRIVGQLRQELRQEVRIAEQKMLRGTTLDQLLASEQASISPLTRYILAHRAGRVDLSSRFRAAAENQHRSCPLYRQAARILLPDPSYPIPDASDPMPTPPISALAFSLN